MDAGIGVSRDGNCTGGASAVIFGCSFEVDAVKSAIDNAFLRSVLSKLTERDLFEDFN